MGIFLPENFLVVVFSRGVDGSCGITLKLLNSALLIKWVSRSWFRLFGSVLGFATLFLSFWTIVTVELLVVPARSYMPSTVTEIRLNLRPLDWEVPSPPVEVAGQQADGWYNGA